MAPLGSHLKVAAAISLPIVVLGIRFGDDDVVSSFLDTMDTAPGKGAPGKGGTYPKRDKFCKPDHRTTDSGETKYSDEKSETGEATIKTTVVPNEQGIDVPFEEIRCKCVCADKFEATFVDGKFSDLDVIEKQEAKTGGKLPEPRPDEGKETKGKETKGKETKAPGASALLFFGSEDPEDSLLEETGTGPGKKALPGEKTEEKKKKEQGKKEELDGKCDCEPWCKAHAERGEDRVGNRINVTEEEDRLAALIFEKIMNDEEAQNDLKKVWTALSQSSSEGLEKADTREQVTVATTELRKMLEALDEIPDKKNRGALLMTMGALSPPKFRDYEGSGPSRILFDAEHWETWGAKKTGHKEHVRYKKMVMRLNAIKKRGDSLFGRDDLGGKKGRGSGGDHCDLESAFRTAYWHENCPAQLKRKNGISTCTKGPDHPMLTTFYPGAVKAWKAMFEKYDYAIADADGPEGQIDDAVCNTVSRGNLKNWATGHKQAGSIAREFYHCGVPYVGGMSGSILEQIIWIDEWAKEALTPKTVLALAAALEVCGAHALSELIPVAQNYFECVESPEKCRSDPNKTKDDGKMVKVYEELKGQDQAKIEQFADFTKIHHPIYVSDLDGEGGFCRANKVYGGNEEVNSDFDAGGKNMAKFTSELEAYIEKVFSGSIGKKSETKKDAKKPPKKRPPPTPGVPDAKEEKKP